MSSRPTLRRRQTTTLLVVNCAFAEDCQCSKTGYKKKGNLKNHLEKAHPTALGLVASAPHCYACGHSFASKGLLIDHIINMHVHACELSSPAPTVSSHPLPAASSLSSHEDIKVGPSPSASTPQSQVVSLPNPATTDREGHADTSHDKRHLNHSTFSYINPADTTAYIHPISPGYLPPTPMGIDPRVNIQSDADQRHECDQFEQLEHS